MSTTYSFYFKANDGKFYPLDSFGGGSAVAVGMSAQFGSNYTYEKRMPLMKADLRQIISFEEDRVRTVEERIEGYQKRQKDIGSWNNSVEEKSQMVCDLDDAIDEEKCSLSYYKRAASFFEFLLGILDEAELFSPYDEISIDVNNYLYWEVS